MLLTLSHDLRHYFGLRFLSCRLGHKFKQDFSRLRQENTNLVIILLLFIITEPTEMRLFNDLTVDLALKVLSLEFPTRKKGKEKLHTSILIVIIQAQPNIIEVIQLGQTLPIMRELLLIFKVEGSTFRCPL